MWGVGWGLFAGVFFCAIAAVAIGLQGGLPEPASSIVLFLSVYPATGIIGGVIVGALRTWINTRVRAMVVAMVVMLPAGAGFLVLRNGSPADWGGSSWFALLLGSIILGVMGGHQAWKASRPFPPNAKGRSNPTRGPRR